jgi:hypothetical protein
VFSGDLLAFFIGSGDESAAGEMAGGEKSWVFTPAIAR